MRCLTALLAGVLVAGAAIAGPPKLQTATFAGGCFWCMQEAFDGVPGVVSTTAGYTGGTKPGPTYEQVSDGGTGHAESVELKFDPAKISYERLLDIYWHNIDPTVKDQQFCDRGHQYRSAIFYHDDAQKKLAERSKAEIEKSGVLPGPIQTQIVLATAFYPAEDYHQQYYKKNSWRYRLYRTGCGRDRRLAELWGAAAGKGAMETSTR